MRSRVRKTRVTVENRIQVKVWVWSTEFLAPFPDFASADKWRRAEWPEAEHLESQ